MTAEMVTVHLEAGEYSAVQDKGYVVAVSGGFILPGFGEIGGIEDAAFYTDKETADRVASTVQGEAKAVKRMIVDFYELEEELD